MTEELKSKKELQFLGGGGGKLQFTGPKKEVDDGFSFEATPTTKVDNFMEKKYKYKKDDIFKNKSESIWKIITNRYNRSGYDRLFSE